jgi:hypothetical protein
VHRVPARRSTLPRTLVAATAALLLAFIASGAFVTTESWGETVGNFSFGELGNSAIGATGCGTNKAGEPAIHVSRLNDVFLGSENGIGSGSELWRGLGALGGSGASGCALEYRGQPNVVAEGAGASGGDIDIAIANAKNALGNYNLYVSSLNLGSVNVATSADNATTFTQSPVQSGLPGDDRDWIAAFGAETALLSFHDIATNNIEILRSDDGGKTFAHEAFAIPVGDYKEERNQHGNLVIDHRNLPDTTGDFYAYQSFVAPSAPAGEHNNEAFLAVSADGGHSWTDRPVPCSTASPNSDLAHNFPDISVDPAGRIWYAWSDNTAIRTALSSDHGVTWTCSGVVSRKNAQAIFPWLAATSRGVDLVYYGTQTANKTWYVYFAQNLTAGVTRWRAPQRLMPVHTGEVCETGIECTSGRQLFDDFGVDTDSLGFAHIAYSHDSPALGGEETFTGYAVQTAGTTVGEPNN